MLRVEAVSMEVLSLVCVPGTAVAAMTDVKADM